MRNTLIMAALLAIAAPAMASDVGLIKVSKGDVRIERAGARLPAGVGAAVQASDVIVTGGDGLAGITFTDNSLVSLGPNSVFSIDKYRFLRNAYLRARRYQLYNGKPPPEPEEE